MKNSDCKIPPFYLVYNMYISRLYGASYFVFIAKNAIYCLRVYVYSTFMITNFIQIPLHDICNLGLFVINWDIQQFWNPESANRIIVQDFKMQLQLCRQ
jgi:hypothetical protein